MAAIDGFAKCAEALGGGVRDLVQLGVSLTERSVDAGAKIMEERKTFVQVPEIYSSNYRLKVEDAKRWLEEDGLKAEAVVVRPDIAFKDCQDSEVVETNYKLKQKVKPGTRIILKYVTSEVIKDSQKLFDESEKQKAEAEQKKAEKQEERAKKKLEQGVKNKQIFDETVANVKKGFSSTVINTQKGIEGVYSNFKKKKKSKDDSNK